MVDILVRSLLLCALAFVGARWLESRSATWAHRLWLATLLAITLLPLSTALRSRISWTVPGWATASSWVATTWRSSNRPSAVIPATVRSNTPVGNDNDLNPTSGLQPRQADGSLRNKMRNEDGTTAFGSLESTISTDLNAGTAVDRQQLGLGDGSSGLGDAGPGTAADKLGRKLPSNDQATEAVTKANGPPRNPIAAITAILSTGPAWGATCWLMGSAVLLLQLIVQLLKIPYFLQRCRGAPADTTRWIAEYQAELGLHRQVRLRIAAPGVMPLALWWGRWFVVLPADIVSWRSDTRRSTIMHELGHVARRDAWTDLLAQVLWRLLWPNFLLLVGMRELRRLRERACDEWVVGRGGMSPTDYARGLVEAVTRVQHPAVALSTGLSQSNDLRKRVLRLLQLQSFPTDHVGWKGIACSLLVTLTAMSVALGGPAAQEGITASGASAAAGDTAGTAARTTSVAAQTPLGEPAAAQTGDAESNSRPAVVLSKEPAPATPNLTCEGRIRDSSRKPIVGVKIALYVRNSTSYHSGVPYGRNILATTHSADDGSYSFKEVPIPPRFSKAIESLTAPTRSGPRFEVVAWGPGYGLGHSTADFRQDGEHRSMEFSDEVDLTLSPEADVVGRVTDKLGEPLDGVNFKVVGIWRNPAKKLLTVLDEASCRLRAELDLVATSNALGQFSLPNLPQDCAVLVEAQHPQGFHERLIVDTSRQAHLSQLKIAGVNWPFHRPPIDLVVHRTQGLFVKVEDADGAPVTSGILLAVDSHQQFGGYGFIDALGRACLNVKEPGDHEIYYRPDPLVPRLGARVTAVIESVFDETLMMKLPKQDARIRGTVRDASTNMPIAGVHVVAGHERTGVTGITNRQGEYELPAFPGRFRVLIGAQDVHGYFLPDIRDVESGGDAIEQQVEIEEADASVEVNFKLSRGLVITGIVLNSDGTPASSARVTAANQARPNTRASAITDSEGRFEVFGLSPRVDTLVRVSTERGGAEIKIPGVANQPLEKPRNKAVVLKLEHGVVLAGRLLKQGKPASGVRLQLHKTEPVKPNEQSHRYEFFAETITDEKGEFRISGLKRDELFQFQFHGIEGWEAIGWPYQSPYIQRVEQDSGDMILPDAKLIQMSQIVSGVVVDTQGAPVEGMTVSASLANGKNLARPRNGPAPWTETDAEGRFRLSYLPDAPINLMVYRRDPAGGRILRPSKVSPRMNQQDIRILVDPRLNKPLEKISDR